MIKDLKLKYRDSLVGVVWFARQPAALILVYSFVFGRLNIILHEFVLGPFLLTWVRQATNILGRFLCETVQNKTSRIVGTFIRSADCQGFRITLWLYLSLFVFLTPLAGCASTSGQTNEDNMRALSKVGPELAALYDEYSAALASDKTGGFRSANPLVRVIEDRVVIDAVASDDVNVLKADLSSLGMQQAVALGRIVSGQLPISAIPAMSALPSLNFARASSAMLLGPKPR